MQGARCLSRPQWPSHGVHLGESGQWHPCRSVGVLGVPFYTERSKAVEVWLSPAPVRAGRGPGLQFLALRPHTAQTPGLCHVGVLGVASAPPDQTTDKCPERSRLWVNFFFKQNSGVTSKRLSSRSALFCPRVSLINVKDAVSTMFIYLRGGMQPCRSVGPWPRSRPRQLPSVT